VHFLLLLLQGVAGCSLLLNFGLATSLVFRYGEFLHDWFGITISCCLLLQIMISPSFHSGLAASQFGASYGMFILGGQCRPNFARPITHRLLFVVHWLFVAFASAVRCCLLQASSGCCLLLQIMFFEPAAILD